MLLWIDEPQQLFSTVPSLQLLFNSSAHLNERQNTLAQFVLAGSLGLSIYKRSFMPLIAALCMLLTLGFISTLEQNKRHKSYLMTETIFNTTPRTWPATESTMSPQNPCQCPPTLNLLHTETGNPYISQAARQPVWGGAPSQQLAEYPNNPTRFDQPYAVRSRLPGSLRVTPDSSLARTFNSPETMPFDQLVAPIPDSTLMARQPVCLSSPFTVANDMRDQGKMRWI